MTAAASSAAASSTTPPPPRPPSKFLLRRKIFKSRNVMIAAALVVIGASISTFGNLLSVGSSRSSSSKGVDDGFLPPSDAGRGTTNDVDDDDVDDFPSNSEAWTNGLRFGNVDPRDPDGDDASILEGIIRDQIISNPFRQLATNGGTGVRPVLDRTICDARSRFVTNGDAPWTTTTTNATDDRTTREERVEDDAFLLMYLAMHENQNGPARDEARARLKRRRRSPPRGRSKDDVASPSSPSAAAPVGPYDYECRSAKFIVAHMPGMGMGGAFRFGVVDTLVKGLLLNRVGLMMNNLGGHWGANSSKFVNYPHEGSGIHQWMAGKMPSASCDRGDLQCFFEPLSPCVITEEELRKAPILDKAEWRSIKQNGKLPEKYDNERVVVALPPTHPPRSPSNALIHDAVRRIANWTETDEASDSVRRENALQFIRKGMPNEWISYVAPFYALRPNRHYRRKIDEAMSRMFPSDFRPENALGLPVRSSDKCFGESECLTFDQYMKLAKSVASREKAATKGNNATVVDTLILTSESLSFVQNKSRYERNSTFFPFRFVTNDDDVSQGTGNPKDYKKLLSLNVTADDIMLSSVIAIRMQLMAGRTVGNCCSNFHRLMKELLDHGCGASARHKVFECMQENENPKFRLCCAWTKTEECKAKKQEGTYGKDFQRGTDYLRDGIAKGKKRRRRRR